MSNSWGYRALLDISRREAEKEGTVRHPVPSVDRRRVIADHICNTLNKCSDYNGGCLYCSTVKECTSFYDDHYCAEIDT